MNKLRFILIASGIILIVLSQGIIAVPSKDYVLGSGDVLEVHAWNESNSDILIVNPIPPGITTVYADPHILTVSRDGRVYIPMIGTINVADLTIGMLEGMLEKKLVKFTENPKVSVMVKTPKGIKVNVAGEVAKPGLYEVPDGNPFERSVLNYIKLAGGTTDYAGLEDVTIMKRNNESITVNLRKLIVEKDMSQNVTLADGDSIIVPQASNQVYVLGQVINPGGKKFIAGAVVSDYVGMAGGLNKFAASDNIGIIRGDSKKPEVIKVNLSEYINWEARRVQVLPGDIIFVPQSWFANWADMGALIVIVRDARDATRDLASPSQWEAK